ncbi:MAG: LysE family transporter [Bacteroidaceae bacterium]|nr:LysE family transporter [Bacteroidaceae bacterium]
MILMNTLTTIFQGLIIGIIVSAPLGPVGVLCIQRTLNKGRWYGFVTGLGASLSDIIYALLTGFGMSFIFDFINSNQQLLQIFGSIMLLGFGFYTYRSNPMKKVRPTSDKKGSYFHNFLTAFLVSLSNPLIIFLFIGLFARFAFAAGSVNVAEHVMGYLAIAFGAFLWWLTTTFIVDKVRKTFRLRGILFINRLIGVIVMAISLIGVVLTLTGISFI